MGMKFWKLSRKIERMGVYFSTGGRCLTPRDDPAQSPCAGHQEPFPPALPLEQQIVGIFVQLMRPWAGAILLNEIPGIYNGERVYAYLCGLV
jgi:hypothetical protein